MQFPRDPVFAGLLDMKVNREQLRRDREAIARILAQGRDSGLAVDALAMIGSVEKSTELSQALRDLTGKVAELRALRGRYTDANVAVRRVNDEVAVLEQQTIPALATKLTQEMAVQEAGLAQRVDSAAGGLRRIPPLAVEETQLQRSVTLAEQVVTNLQQRYEEARLAEVSAIPDVRLIDPAIEPQQPAASWAVLLVVLAFLGSLGAGVAGAVVRDRTDRRVHYPAHVTGTMGLAILGAVPHLERGGKASTELVVQATSYRALSFIGSGTRTHTGPSLVSSAALPRLLAALRPSYDAIIVDSPPLAAGADAFAIGTATGSMVLVLRTGVSDRELAQTKLEVLAHLPIRMLGAVLNDVRGGLYRYYSYYLEGYEVKEEPEPAWQLVRAPE